MTDRKVVYIISSCDSASWGSSPENTNATLNKEKAKEILKKIITDGIEGAEDDEEDIVSPKEIKKFVDDMVNGKTENHYSDEFPGCVVWCDILPLE